MHTHSTFEANRFPVYLIVSVLCIVLSTNTSYADNSKGIPDSAFQSFISKFTIDGYLKNESTHRLHTPSRFSKMKNILQIELKGALSDFLDINALSWIMYDAAYDMDEYPDAVQEEYQSSFTSKDPYDQTFREIYFDLFFDKVDFRIGKQQVVWGEAIGLRITDIINPQDYREFILDDYIDSRIPVWMAKFNYYVGQWSVEGLWIPFFEPERQAITGSEWEWTFNKMIPPQGVQMIVEPPEEPSDDLENGEFGGRLTGILADWNVAASCFYAWDDSPSSHIYFNPQELTIKVDQKFHRLTVLGFTFANAFGRFVPRGELSYKIGKYFNSSDFINGDGLTKKNFLYYMLGTDYSVSDYFFNFQMIQKVIIDYEDKIYEDELQTNVSFQIQAKYFNETLKPEMLTIYGLKEKDWMIRPKIIYAVSDKLLITLGFDIFSGSVQSFLGQFDSNDRGYMEIKYSF